LPQLAKAARLHTKLHSLGWRSSVALRALDQLSAGVIITDREGRVIELNRVAERILRRGDGSCATTDSMHAARPTARIWRGRSPRRGAEKRASHGAHAGRQA
jgi:PAS domain-containing protein